MRADDEIVMVNEDEMDEDELEDHDPESCDDLQCYYAPEFQVTVQRELTFTIHAHSKEAAELAVGMMDLFVVNEPEGVENFNDGYDDTLVESEEDLAEQQRRYREFVAQQEQVTE